MSNNIWVLHKCFINYNSWNITIMHQGIIKKHQSKKFLDFSLPIFAPEIEDSVEYEYSPLHIVGMGWGISMIASHSPFYEYSSNQGGFLGKDFYFDWCRFRLRFYLNTNWIYGCGGFFCGFLALIFFSWC